MTKCACFWIALSLASGLGAGDTPEKKANDLLWQALTAKNPDTRKTAVAALSLAASAGPLFDAFEGMVDDKDVQVRLVVVSSLAEVKTPNARKALEHMLNDSVPEVAFAAAKALYAEKDPKGKQALLSVLEGETKTSSGYFSQQMRQAMRMMHTPKVTFLYAVKQGVGFVPLPGFGMGISSLQAILEDNGVSGRATAALLLGSEKDAATVAALRDALEDKDWHVRAAAVHALALQNNPALRKDLDPMIEDENEAVRLRAAAAVLRLAAMQKRAATVAPAASHQTSAEGRKMP
jgi:HEAT repeat protein